MRIEEYWFGFVVCDAQGVALSQAFKTLEQAEMYLNELKKEGYL